MLNPDELKILETLPEDQQEYVRARFSPPIQSLPTQEFELKILEILKDVFDCHMSDKILTKEAKATSDKVKENIYELLKKDFQKPKFKTIAVGQIELACYKGVRKEFGDFFALNVSTVHTWIDAFLKCKENYNAITNFITTHKESTFQTSDKPKHLKPEESKKGCMEYFQQYAMTGSFGYFPFAYYDIIKNHLGVSTLVEDPEVRKRIKKESKAAYEKELQDKRVGLEKDHKRSEVEAIDYILTNMNKSRGLEFKQKELALKWFFDTLISKGEDLKL